MMRSTGAFYRLAAFLIVAAPATAMATDQVSPPPAESRKEAYADCGGPPIQGGRDIQPTPARDKCLAEKQKNLRRAPPASPPQADDAPPVMPPVELRSDPQALVDKD